MKKKYVASFLSLCMIFTSLNPVVLASDAVELSTVSDVDYLEEEQEDVEEVINDSVDQNIDSEILDESPIDVNENEVVIDEPENVSDDIAEFSDEKTESLITTYEANDGYTALTENSKILCKYNDTEKTLYFKLADGVKEAAMPDLTKPNGSTWTKAVGARNMSVKKIIFDEGITHIGAYNFACGSAKYYQTLQEIVLPSTVTSIGERAFQIFNSETTGTKYEQRKINLSNVKKIGASAFEENKLDKVDLSAIEEIGDNAFTNCSSLKSICYSKNSEEWNKIASNAGLQENVAIHCKADPAPVHATCETDGQNILTCEICGSEYTDGTVAPALGHDYAEDYTVDKEATCTEAGSESKHCTRCDEIEAGSEKEIPVLGHDYVAEVTTQPTCTKDGVRTLTCTRCKDVKTEVIPATGVHQWSDWKKTADATVFAPEQQERSCTICGKTETQTVGSKMSATATVNVSSVTLKVKQNTSSVKVTGLAKGDSVKTWKSTNTKVFKVTGKADGTCKLTGVKKGTAKLEIILASGLKKTVTVKVQAKTVKTSKISGLAKKMTVKKGTKTNLKPVITPATSQQKVTYSSSNKKVAIVSSKGVITAKKAGTAKITVKSGSKKVTVTVTVPKTKTTAITVGEKASVKKGKTYSLKAKVVPSNSDEKITYSTSNKKIATVSKSGKIKGVKKGTATITIKSGKVAKKVKVTVK